jgi:hypothetical protein
MGIYQYIGINSLFLQLIVCVKYAPLQTNHAANLHFVSTTAAHKKEVIHTQ